MITGQSNTVGNAKTELLRELEKMRKGCGALDSAYQDACNKANNSEQQKYIKKIKNFASNIDLQIDLIKNSDKMTSANFSVLRTREELKELEQDKRELFESRIDDLYHGLELANRMCSYNNTDLYLLLYRQAGDILNLMAKIPAIKKYYGTDAGQFHFDKGDGKSENKAFIKKKHIERVFIITKPDNVGVVRLFSEHIDGIQAIKYDDLRALAAYALSPCAIHQNIFCEADGMRLMGNRKDTDESQWCRLKMFGGVLDLERELCIPHDIFKPSCKPVLSDITQKMTDEFIAKTGFDAEDSLVLSPYSKFSSMLDGTVWTKIVQALQGRYQKIYTYVNWGENAVPGTETLRTDIDILACLSARGCKIIGIHGSNTDVISKVAPQNLICFSVIKNDKDREYAKARKVLYEVNYLPSGAIYLRLEHFEEDYILRLLNSL